MSSPDLPTPALLTRQASWLVPVRARLLRRLHVARRGAVLDLGCGYGAVTAELVQRAGGPVLAVDRNPRALADAPGPFAGATRLCADALRLPLVDGSFDLVFSQFALLWLDAPAAVREIHRILQPGGVLAAVEPDYAGLIEHPAEIATRDIWLSALARAGADSRIGRKLPGLLAAAGFEVRVDLLDRLRAPSPARFDLLDGLPLTATERKTLQQIRQSDAACQDHARVAHLPIFAVTATKQ